MATANKKQAAAYVVLVDDAEIAPEHADRVKEIRMADYLRLPDICSLQVTYPQGEGIDSHPFRVGAPLEVRLGAADSLTTQTLFKGRVMTLEPEFGAGGCTLTVRAFDRSHELNRSRRVRTFQNQTASDIVKRVASEAGLSPKCDPSPTVHDFIQQNNETDLDFIWRLADRIGFEFVVEDTVAHFYKPSAEPDLELEWPTTLRSFRPRVTAIQQVEEVTLLAQDPRTKRPISASAKNPQQITEIGLERKTVVGALGGGTLHVAGEPVWTQGEADALSQALLDRLANGYLTAEGIAAGDPRIRAGTTMRVKGVGTKFSGTYRVTKATHVLRGGGAYETHFSNSPAETILGAVGAGGNGNGRGHVHFGAQLVIGIVTNNKDPDGIGRIRVHYPALGNESEGAWARLATPGAGAGKGVLMLPVVGDEVLVGFEHGDTTRPYVIGSLWSGGDTPGDELTHDHDGSFAVRSDEAIYMESAKDFTIKSSGNLEVNVAGDSTVKTAGDWTAETDGDASLKAMNFEVEGDMNVTIKGGVSIKLEASGSSIELGPAGVTIKGTLINIG